MPRDFNDLLNHKHRFKTMGILFLDALVKRISLFFVILSQKAFDKGNLPAGEGVIFTIKQSIKSAIQHMQPDAIIIFSSIFACALANMLKIIARGATDPEILIFSRE